MDILSEHQAEAGAKPVHQKNMREDLFPHLPASTDPLASARAEMARCQREHDEAIRGLEDLGPEAGPIVDYTRMKLEEARAAVAREELKRLTP